MEPVTIREAARRTGIPRATLTRWARIGRLQLLSAPEGRGRPATTTEQAVREASADYQPGRGKGPRPSRRRENREFRGSTKLAT